MVKNTAAAIPERRQLSIRLRRHIVIIIRTASLRRVYAAADIELEHTPRADLRRRAYFIDGAAMTAAEVVTRLMSSLIIRRVLRRKYAVPAEPELLPY